MLSNNEVTKGLLIAVLGANLFLLFFIAWHVATARLYFRQVHRLAIAIVRKMDCDELIDEMLSCSGGTAEKQRYKGTAGDCRAYPDASSGGGHEVTGQSRQQPAEPDRMQNYRERLASVAAECQAGRYGLLAHGKALTASHIEEIDDSEIQKLYARYEARLGAAMTKTLGSAALQLYAGVVSMFLPIPAESQAGLIADLEGDPLVGHTLSSATCELYHRYGIFLAPLTQLSTVNLVIDVLLPSVTEIKQTAENPQAVPVERPAETASPAEPAHAERVTKKKAKDQKKVAAGRAGAAARQKRLLEQLQANKELLRPPVSAADNDGTSASPKEGKRTDERQEANWIPWIIGACLAGGSLAYVFAGEKMRLRASPASIAAGPEAKVQDSQLKACPDPHYME